MVVTDYNIIVRSSFFTHDQCHDFTCFQRLAEQLATLKKAKSAHELLDLNSSIEDQFAIQRGENADKTLDGTVMISAICTKTFSNLYTFLAVDSVRHVTSQEDMNDIHFLPLHIVHS